MTTRDTVELVLSAWDQGDADAIRRLYTEDYRDHDPLPGSVGGVEGVIQQVGMLTSAFADGHTEVEDVVEVGDKVCVRWSFTGTHAGDFMGTPASGNSVSVQGMEFWRMRDGRIAEAWTTVDLLALMMQVGAIPTG